MKDLRKWTTRNTLRMQERERQKRNYISVKYMGRTEIEKRRAAVENV